jgi:hypothetical protein
MLTALSTGLRFRLASMLAVFAALCFVLPPVTLALGHGENAAACLLHADTVDHGRVGPHDVAQIDEGRTVAHVAHKTALDEYENEGDHALPACNHQMTCCGLLCLSAVVVSGNEALDQADLGVPRVATPTPHLLVRAPERPERPPNTLMSV